jgi:type IV secretion system protein VirB1
MIVAMLAAVSLGSLLRACAPDVGSLTMRALIARESAGLPFAIDDDTERRSYTPSSRAEAERIAVERLRAGHSIDVGLTQINSAHFATFGLTASTALDPCTNVAVGARILRDAYVEAARVDGPGQRALVHALSIYHTGRPRAGFAYARDVYATGAALRAGDPP